MRGTGNVLEIPVVVEEGKHEGTHREFSFLIEISHVISASARLASKWIHPLPVTTKPVDGWSGRRRETGGLQG